MISSHLHLLLLLQTHPLRRRFRWQPSSAWISSLRPSLSTPWWSLRLGRRTWLRAWWLRSWVCLPFSGTLLSRRRGSEQPDGPAPQGSRRRSAAWGRSRLLIRRQKRRSVWEPESPLTLWSFWERLPWSLP